MQDVINVLWQARKNDGCAVSKLKKNRKIERASLCVEGKR